MGVLQNQKYLISWAKASKMTVLGVSSIVSYGAYVGTIIIKGRDGNRLMVDPGMAYNLYWGPNTVDYGNMYYPWTIKKRAIAKEKYFANKANKA